jgi:murein DD-endopeptidase MepM/ murein hydrolase activator NlpD
MFHHLDERAKGRLNSAGRLFADDVPMPHPATTHYLLTALAIAAMVIGSALQTLVFAAPANADATATVKARTQRMSDANLSSQQNGWYAVGNKLTLVCSKRGQAVKGFFSFNIPNGGWDNLWYKTSDGNFVADVDIETGTLNVVAPDCGSAPAPVAQPPVAAPSGLRWPLDNVSVNRGFGTDGHNGIDLRAGVGTPVYAADAGVVEFEGRGQDNPWMTRIAGICVLIKHSNIYTGYAHLSRTVINNGQQVAKGQLIGYSGDTGQVSGPHLHFEVLQLNHQRVDPGPYLG